MENDEVRARLQRALEELVAEAMDYGPETPVGTDYVRLRDAAAELFRGGLVPGSKATLVESDDAIRERVSMLTASAFGTGVLVGLTAARSN
jgi:hypothetical protein